MFLPPDIYLLQLQMFITCLCNILEPNTELFSSFIKVVEIGECQAPTQHVRVGGYKSLKQARTQFLQCSILEHTVPDVFLTAGE